MSKNTMFWSKSNSPCVRAPWTPWNQSSFPCFTLLHQFNFRWLELVCVFSDSSSYCDSSFPLKPVLINTDYPQRRWIPVGITSTSVNTGGYHLHLGEYRWLSPPPRWIIVNYSFLRTVHLVPEIMSKFISTLPLKYRWLSLFLGHPFTCC